MKLYFCGAVFASALLFPFPTLGADVDALSDVSTDGVTIHNGDKVTRSELTSANSSWTFDFAWPNFVPNYRAHLFVFRGTFGNVEGGMLVDGVNYSAQQQGWPAPDDTTPVVSISRAFSLPALGDRATPSGTYTIVLADTQDVQSFLDWFSSGGTSGTEPADYSKLSFTYSATDNPEDLPNAVDSLVYRGITIHDGDSFYRDDLPPLDTSDQVLDKYWNFHFHWPNFVSNQSAELMIFHGTFGNVEGGMPIPDANYGFAFQQWSAEGSDFGAYLELPALKDSATPAGTYTLMVSERDPKYASDYDSSQEALWFSSGGTDGIPPLRYSFLTFNFKGDKPTCCDSVMFLPGIEESRLYRPGILGIGEKWLWEPKLQSDIQQLALNPDGSSLYDDIYTKKGDVVSQIYNAPFAPQFYKSFLGQLDSLKTTGKINDWEAVPYDWRLSFDDILGKGAETPDGHISYLTATDTPYISQELKRLAATSQTGKVTIVAHSMGGLVAKELLRRLGDAEAEKYVNKMILVASPQVGTPLDIGSMIHGYDQTIGFGSFVIMNDADARTFATNAPSTYSLLPSAGYFTSVQSPVVTFPDSSNAFAKEIAAFGNTVDTFQKLSDFLNNAEGRPVPAPNDTESAGVVNTSLFSATTALHTNIDAWTPPSGINVVQIAGWGEDTVSGFEYYFGKRKQCFAGVGITETINGNDKCVGPEVRPVFTSDGDDTVVVSSALYISTSSPNVQSYWVDLHRYNSANDQKSGHGNILEAYPVLNFINNILTKTADINPPEFISTTVPPSFTGIKPLLRFRLHSPLTIDIYDANGNHTGISTTTSPDSDIQHIDENIPNSYYFELGDTKYLGVSDDGNTTIVMNGYAAGTFDFDIDQVEGDTTVASTSFSGVPSSSNTAVRMTIGDTVASASNLDVDSDGNGATDFSLTPVVGQVVPYVPPTPTPTPTPTPIPIPIPEESQTPAEAPARAVGGGGPIYQNVLVDSGVVLGTSTIRAAFIATTSDVRAAPQNKFIAAISSKHIRPPTRVRVVVASTTPSRVASPKTIHSFSWFLSYASHLLLLPVSYFFKL